MQITAAQWHKYIEALSTVDRRAGREMKLFLDSQALDYSDPETIEMIVKYAYGLSDKYGDAVAELACEMYDSVAAAQGANVPAAEPAEVATYGETEKAIRGSLKQSPSGQLLQPVVERLVKQAGADTMLKNARRDGAYFAWVPHGDTCAYCLALAAIGWQKAGKKTFSGDHAEHIHAHCDCTYAVDFKGDMEISGYDPDSYRDQIRKMTGDDSLDNDDMIRMVGHNAKGQSDYDYLNLIRRKNYAENKDVINAQKRAAYAISHSQLLSMSITNLRDEVIGKSVGSKFKNYDIMDLTSGEHYHLAEGTHLQNKTVFAGKGTNTELRIAKEYAEKYGGNPEDWQHVKALGTVSTPDGDVGAEIHWMQCEGIGKKDLFVKKWLE